MLHTSYYTHFSPGYSDNVLKDHIYGSFNNEDLRFNHKVDYNGIGNSYIMRVNACAVLRLHMWYLNPAETSNSKAFVKYLAHVVVTPFAALHDVALNTALSIVKIAASALIISGKIASKIVNPWSDVQLKNTTYYVVMNLYSQVDSTVNSFFYATYQLLTLGLTNLLKLQWDPYFRCSEQFNWSYYVNRNELLLDQGRIVYLQNQCGWNTEKLNEITQLFKPWTNPPSVRIEYRNTPEGLEITRHWTQMQYR